VGSGRAARVLFGITITRGKIVEIEMLADRLHQLDLVVLNA
jgi:hypothetical protein